MRLSPDNARRLPASVQQPKYDWNAQQVGIVHIGLGAFCRSHLAVYTDEAMNAGNAHWRILGVSLRSAYVAQQLNPQGGLYTVTTRAPTGDHTRLIGSIQNVLVGREAPTSVASALAAPGTHIVSFTITEKGYCRASSTQVDDQLADQNSVWHHLRNGLSLRRDAGLPGVTLLCCDNLAHNGRQLETLLQDYLQRHDPALAQWVAQHCTCPSTMVDRIVPASSSDALAALQAKIGMEDAGAVFTEPFSQWVIEDRFAGPRPDWNVGGAQFVADVRPFEMAKLRMLNGAHSMLAYRGSERGYTYVHEAIADPELFAAARELMLVEAASTLPATSGFDATQYAHSLLQRFANSALPHRLLQIAMDGSQKIPQRWLETLAARDKLAMDSPRLMQALASWLRFVRGDRFKVDDPAARELAGYWSHGGVDEIVDALFGEHGRMALTWRPDTARRLMLKQLVLTGR